MKVFWDQDRGGRNFGDALNSFLLERIFGVPVEWADSRYAELFCIGSVVEAIPSDFSGTVLGCGLMFEESRISLPRARVLALRGQLTADRVVEPHFSPYLLLADPGLLAGRLAPERERDVQLGTIRHYVDERPSEGLEIDPLWDIEQVLALAARCQRIVSSSLHGLILADSLGIPNLWDPHPGVLGNGFKFRDYASSFGETIEPGVWRLANPAAVIDKQQRLLTTISRFVLEAR